MDSDERHLLGRLLRESRWGALATTRNHDPLASWVAFAPEEDLCGFILHLSRLALHTRYLLVNPRASLSISEPDIAADGDPQQLARVSLQGHVVVLRHESKEYVGARELYLRRLPAAETQFGLRDFYLMRFVPEIVRYISGFGRVYRLGPPDLRALAGSGT